MSFAQTLQATRFQALVDKKNAEASEERERRNAYAQRERGAIARLSLPTKRELTRLAALGDTRYVVYQTWALDIDERGFRDADIMCWFRARHGDALYGLPFRSKRARIQGLRYCIVYVDWSETWIDWLRALYTHKKRACL